MPDCRTRKAARSRSWSWAISSRKFGDGAGGGRLIDDPFFGLLDLGIGGIVQSSRSSAVSAGKPAFRSTPDLGAALQKLLFAKSLFQPFPAAFRDW